MQWLKFKSGNELSQWQQNLADRLSSGQNVESVGSQTVDEGPGEAASGMSSDSKTEPVVLLKSRPGTRFQLLGMVEAKAPSRRGASAGLAIRGSMMGADAVVDLNQERLPGFRKTEHRASGMAVCAVDDEGRLELKTRWFSSQIGQIAIIMLVVAGLEVSSDLLGLLFLPSIETGFNFAGGAMVAGLAAGLAFWKWPQFVRPTAFCFIVKVVNTGLGMIGNLIGSAVMGYAAYGQNPLYQKTLGVSRYRAGDFSAAIEALKRSIEGRGFNGPEAFFLAMAHARLGQHDAAGNWYLQANRWTRQNHPNDAELRRFREEAVAVLDVADDRAPRTQKMPEKPPAPIGTAPASKPN